MSRNRSLLGEGPEVAARQLAMLLLGGALLVVLIFAGAPAGRQALIGIIAAVQLALASAGWVLPWGRWPPWAPLFSGVAEMVLLGIVTWAFTPLALGTAPFFLLLFVWAGLHYRVAVVLGLAGVAVATYLVPVLAAGRGVLPAAGAMVFLPGMVLTGVLLARQTDRHHRDLAAVRRAHDEVQQADRWRAALIATLAHDVRSPLTTVQFALQTLEEDGDLPGEQRTQIITAALRQTERIRRLAGDLLDAERVDAHGELRLDRRPVAVRAVAHQALEYLTCPVSLEVGEEVAVDADPKRLGQILVNLVTNAARYGRPPVVISAGPATDGMVAIRVRDHGSGVPEVVRGVLFSRFSHTNTVPDSVGLGLWITRELARAHGGDVTYSPADPGARFTVTLPAARSRSGVGSG
ncbi:hypothetical protein Ppa06_42260 [Planomonospora parontospora subsp. parontospora]|uniref:histidine kinase n=2 Tax=Planomonospora parontospora TaxID=58119 RepID=A0AA37BK68_9ACTN|nr:HAMP domain-containing sensor histidine kinase [Planomonospora parontospora]GGK83192.1 hypothetical protein GCM10010126_48120 [Planomonospora parontospora]GII10428.1 hypothetical protein Ppa06_42260 [Planomonospora parontospora subsp. parontospora]